MRRRSATADDSIGCVIQIVIHTVISRVNQDHDLDCDLDYDLDYEQSAMVGGRAWGTMQLRGIACV